MDEYLQRLVNFAQLCVLAFMASAAKVAYHHINGAEFKFGLFVSFLTIAIFSAWLMGTLLPQDFVYRDAFIGVAAWSGSEFVRFLERQLIKRAGDLIK